MTDSHPSAAHLPARAPLLQTARDLNAMGLLPHGRIVAVAAVAILVVALEGTGVAMLLPLLDFVQAGGDVAALQEGSQMWRHIVSGYALVGLPVTLLTLCLTVFVAIVLRQLTAYFDTVWRTQLRHDVGRRMSVRLFRELMESEARHIQQLGTGSIAYLLGTQVHAANALLNSFSQLWVLMLTFGVYGLVILIAAPSTSLLAFGVVGVALAGVARYVRVSGDISRKLVAVGEQWTRFITERYRAWRLIKLAHSVDRETERARKFTDRIYSQSIGLARIQGRVELFVAPFLVFAILSALYISVEFFSISLSVITLFVVIVMRLAPVARGLAKLRQSIAVQRANLDRVMRAFHEAGQAREIDTGTEGFDGRFQSIVLQKVSFHYDGGDMAALDDVTAVIEAGKMTAIMGPSGAGKSTLVDLLPRLITPTSGQILIDDKPLVDFTLASLRSNIAYVAQDPLIFNDTVIENVRYLRPAASVREVEHACEVAIASDFVKALPNSYETVLGENGIGLSGGQRQRIALARAYLAGPSILILDEPTSALDYESESEVQQALENLYRDKGITVVVIAHRFSTVRNADTVLVLEGGKLTEFGAPEDLRRSDSWYSRMLSLDNDPRNGSSGRAKKFIAADFA